MTCARRLGGRCRTSRLLPLLGALLSPLAWSQVAAPPGAGNILRETTPLPRQPAAPPAPVPDAPPARPATPRPAEVTFALRRVRFVGMTVFAESELQAIAAPRIGKPATLSDIEVIAEQVTERYRAAGYLLAQAIVPAQDVTDGSVEISVLEGRIGRIRVELEAGTVIDEARMNAFLAPLRAGQLLQQASLSRSMLLLSDLPGLAVETSLEAGEASGTTDLIVTGKPRRRWDLAFDLDNHGSRATSEYRAGMQGRWNSPLRLGDNLDYRLQLGEAGRLAFGRLAYERPVGGQGYRIGLAASRLEYELGKDFAALDASGTAKVIDLTAAYPFIRSRPRNLFGKLTLQNKALEDRFGSFALVNEKRIRAASFALSYEQSDRFLGGGYSSAGLSATFGRLTLGSTQQRDADRAARRTQGGFSHVNYTLARLNALSARSTVFIGLAGQRSDKNLDSAEKISVGGPRGVRAYAPSEATADEGHILNVEYRFSPTPALSLQMFYDQGRARLNRHPGPLDTANKVRLRGYGAGIYWSSANGYSLRATLAWPDGNATTTSGAREPRLYFQFGKTL